VLRAALANFKPRESIRTRLRPAAVCAYIERGEGELKSLEGRYLQTVSYTKSTVG
jgi:hypothetical protein